MLAEDAGRDVGNRLRWRQGPTRWRRKLRADSSRRGTNDDNLAGVF